MGEQFNHHHHHRHCRDEHAFSLFPSRVLIIYLRALHVHSFARLTVTRRNIDVFGKAPYGTKTFGRHCSGIPKRAEAEK